MEPEPDRIDLSVLDPGRWDDVAARVAQRGRELRRLRRAVLRRGIVAVVVAAAAALALWFGAPKREAPRPRGDILEWATRDVTADDVLQLGGSHAQ